VSQPPQYPQYPQYPGQSGYPPPPSPGYPGHPGHPGYPPPATAPETNRFAVAAVVFGAIGGILFSVVFAIVALVQIPSRGQKGKKLAYIALALSAAWTLACGGIIVAIEIGDAKRDPSGAIAEAGDVSVDDLRGGDCIDRLPRPANNTYVDGVPCTQEHGWQVFATFDLDDNGAYPGEDKIFTLGEAGCNERLEGLSTEAADDDTVKVYLLAPSRNAWQEQHNRTVTCLIGSDTGRFTGPLVS
jgi:hypothetical protein